LRVIADHIRAVAFAIAIKRKNGLRYRRILRRAIRYGYSYFFPRINARTRSRRSKIFPELNARAFVAKVIEEKTF
jgi:alanyl-tRNA synthetase